VTPSSTRRGRLVCVRGPQDRSRSGEHDCNRRVVGLHQAMSSWPERLLSPRLSPDGSRLAWRHPESSQHALDGTELWVGTLDDGGSGVKLVPVGSTNRSSSRSGRPRCSAFRLDLAVVEPVLPARRPGRAPSGDGGEFGRPQWIWRSHPRARVGGSHRLRRGAGHLAAREPETASRAWQPSRPRTPRSWASEQPGCRVLCRLTDAKMSVAVDLSSRVGAALLERR
jgi:hypothetical protein